ncbi:unnamed protein product, partial [Rotaria sordida]
IEFGTSLEKLTNEDLKQLYATTLTNNRLPLKGKEKNAICRREEFYSDYFNLILDNTNKNNNLLLLDVNMPLRIVRKTTDDQFLIKSQFIRQIIRSIMSV